MIQVLKRDSWSLGAGSSFSCLTLRSGPGLERHCTTSTQTLTTKMRESPLFQENLGWWICIFHHIVHRAGLLYSSCFCEMGCLSIIRFRRWRALFACETGRGSTLVLISVVFHSSIHQSYQSYLIEKIDSCLFSNTLPETRLSPWKSQFFLVNTIKIRWISPWRFVRTVSPFNGWGLGLDEIDRHSGGGGVTAWHPVVSGLVSGKELVLHVWWILMFEWWFL